jgi:hypothetical protein
MNDGCVTRERYLEIGLDVPTATPDGTFVERADMSKGSDRDFVEEMLELILQTGPEGKAVTLSEEGAQNVLFILRRLPHLSQESLRQLAAQMEAELNSNLS